MKTTADVTPSYIHGDPAFFLGQPVFDARHRSLLIADVYDTGAGISRTKRGAYGLLEDRKQVL